MSRCWYIVSIDAYLEEMGGDGIYTVSGEVGWNEDTGCRYERTPCVLV